MEGSDKACKGQEDLHGLGSLLAEIRLHLENAERI